MQNIVDINALLSQGKRLLTADIDPNNDYAVVQKFVAGNRKYRGGLGSYETFAVPLSELLGGGATYTGSNGITLVGNDFQFTSQNISQFTNNSGYLTPTTGWILNGNTVGSEKSFGTVDNFALPIITNNVEIARFTATGDFGVNVATPLAKLHVNGTSIFGSIIDNLGGWFHVTTVGAGNGQLFLESGASTNDITAFRLGITGGATGGGLTIYDNAGGSKVVLSGAIGSSRMLLSTDAGVPAFEVTNIGDAVFSNMVAMTGLQTGNGGLVAGDLYKDTAANILAAGDWVIGMKA